MSKIKKTQTVIFQPYEIYTKMSYVPNENSCTLEISEGIFERGI